ncbi:MAG: hypothetical protein J5940_03345 [Clostridia bacterium]|nr:hypothetical protein [Clostridia bacterium]
MEYIGSEDYEYIINKYHDGGRPLGPNENRFVRQDRYFDAGTGLSGDEITANIIENDKKLRDLPHPVRKALAFRYVLENTRISCDRRDVFPAVNAIDRPLNKTVAGMWRREVFQEIIPEVERKRARFERDCVATIWPDYDHSVPIWERVFGLGFRGLLEESEKKRSQKSGLTEEQTAFYDGIKITYGAILSFLGRLEKQAGAEKNARLEKALCNIKDNAPRTFYEALLVDYLYFILSEHVEGLQVRSLSNFDRVFYGFYKNDLANGVSERQIREDLAYFLLQFTAIGNYWGQPVFLGGCKEDESTEINELSYLFLDVYDRMKIYNPKIQIKVADSTPKDFLLKALDMIRRGRNSVVFVIDGTVRKALEKTGIDRDRARLCYITGCYEYSPQGCYGAGMNYMNLLKPLEYALHEGCDGVTGAFAGRKSPKVSEYKSFDAFFDEYKAQLGYVIDQVIDIVNSFEDYLAYINPQSMLAATYPSCIERGADPLCGGASENVSVMAFGFTADAADSLAAIKKYVFDRKELTLGRFVKILDEDFANDEKLRLELRKDRDKYGNGKELPDAIACDIAKFVCSKVCGRPNAKKRGGDWNLGFHVARRSYDDAPRTASSPNGRRRGEELSKNLSASMGMNREGATAAILSATKIDATSFTCDAPLDLGLLPSAVKGDDGLEAMYGLLMTFKKRGGHAMHINVFDAETLRAAQREPEKYGDLQIRVCGWNVLFNNISKEEQDGFIRQAESLI